MKVLRKIIEIDEELCDGCGNCVPSCAEGALEIIDGKAKVIADLYCDGLGACLGECPVGALKIVEREADEFDEEAVEELLAQQKKEEPKVMPMASGGCPSARLQSFGSPAAAPASDPCDCANQAAALDQSESALSHWPVQIMLVPPTAPFLKGADVLVLADCVPVAFPTVHRDFIQGKSVLLGCPKLDNAQQYVEKFTEMFTNIPLKSITCVRMEVPCCGGMTAVIAEALKRSGKDIPFRETVIGVRGNLVKERTIELES